MRAPLRGFIAFGVFVVVGGLVLAGCSGPPREDVGPLIRRYAEAWSDQDAKALGRLTDAPRAASRAVGTYQRTLGPWQTAVRPVGEPECGFGRCEQSFRVTHQIPGVGPWRYSTTATLVSGDGEWQIHWTSANYHPALADDGELRVRPGQRAGRMGATLLTNDGEPLSDTAQVPEAVRRVADRNGTIELVSGDGESDTLHRPERADQKIRLTLSPEAQRAAESALVDIGGDGALVAMRASTGEVLAAVGDGALNGKYEPGSVFSVVSAAALIERGLDTAEEVSCPAQATAGGTAFRNPGGDTRAAGPFWEAFAWSCDTTIVGRVGSLQHGDLTASGQRFGIGASWDIGVPSYSGRLRDAGKTQGNAEQARMAATAIGRDSVTVSPLAMAHVAGTVSVGHPVPPSVVENRTKKAEAADRADDSGERRPTEPNVRSGSSKAPGDGVLTRVRGLLRAGVTDGPAATLEDPEHDLYATSSRTLDQKQEWIIGYRDDLAFAVMVPRDAVGVADRFLTQYS